MPPLEAPGEAPSYPFRLLVAPGSPGLWPYLVRLCLRFHVASRCVCPKSPLRRHRTRGTGLGPTLFQHGPLFTNFCKGPTSKQGHVHRFQVDMNLGGRYSLQFRPTPNSMERLLPLMVPLNKRYPFTPQRTRQIGPLMWKREVSPWPASSFQSCLMVSPQTVSILSLPGLRRPPFGRSHGLTQTAGNSQRHPCTLGALRIWNFPGHLEGRLPAEKEAAHTSITLDGGVAPHGQLARPRL